jgi:hypothetical protein
LIVPERHQNTSVYDYLYNKKKDKQSPKDTIEIEYEKYKDECTFKPNRKRAIEEIMKPAKSSL